MVGRWMASHTILHFGLCCTPFLVPTLLPNYEKNHYKKHIFSLSGIWPCRYYFFLSACLSRNNAGGLHGPASQYAWPNSGLQLGWVGSCYFAAGLVSVSQYILFPSGSRYQLLSSPFSLPVCQIQHLGQWPFISKYDAVGKWQGPSQEVVVFFEQMCFFEARWRVGAGPTCCSAVVDMSWLCCIWNQWYIPVFVLPFWS